MSGLWHTDGRTDGGKWKIGQCSGRPETAKMSVCITKKTFLQYICKLYHMQCWVVKDAENKIIPHIQGGAHFNNCSHRVFYHRPILCCHNYVLQYLGNNNVFQYLSNNNVLQYLGNNNVFQYIAEAHKKPPPRAICYLPATLAGHPPNKHPSTLCTNNREIEHQLYRRIWPVKDRNATTMAPVEGCLLNVTRNRAQRLRH